MDTKLDTVLRVQRFWLRQGIAFEHLKGGGFRLIVGGNVLLPSQETRRTRLSIPRSLIDSFPDAGASRHGVRQRPPAAKSWLRRWR